MRLSHLTALAVLVALVGAMFAVVASAQTPSHKIIGSDSDLHLKSGPTLSLKVVANDYAGTYAGATEVDVTWTLEVVAGGLIFDDGTFSTDDDEAMIKTAAAADGRYKVVATGTDITGNSIEAYVTIGEPGADLASAKIALGTETAGPPAVKETGTSNVSGTINVVVTALNAQGNAPNPDDVSSIHVVASAIGRVVAGEDGTTDEDSPTINVQSTVDDGTAIFTIGASEDGTVSVYAIVFGSGTSIQTEPIELTFTGGAEVLMLGDASGVLPNVAGPPAQGSMDPTPVSITFTVTATDDSGNKAAVPAGLTFEVTDPDGEAVTLTDTGLQITQGAGDDVGTITVTYSSATALDAGQYTLKVTSGDGDAAFSDESTFHVAGTPANIEITADPSSGSSRNQLIAVTVTITDANGVPVAPTMVEFDADGEVLRVSGSKTATTKNGMASARVRVRDAGTGYIDVMVKDGDEIIISDSLSFISTAAGPVTQPDDVECLPHTSEFSTWTCDESTTLGAIYMSLSSPTAVSVYDRATSAWVSYTGGFGSAPASTTVMQYATIYITE